jgi:DNA-binding NarL/FixJ family response regulator
MGARRPRAQSAPMTSVFLVDDSPLIRDRLRAFLASLPGIEAVGEAVGADEAIAAILEVRPELVLLDLHLAQGSGFDVLRAVRDAAPEIDVYMLSGYAAYPYRELAARLGARGYFDKAREFDRVCEILAARAPCMLETTAGEPS